MNETCWKEFYKNYDHITTPSSFAQFTLKMLGATCQIVDVGCGNGRDSYLFAKHGHHVTGIDQAFCSDNGFKNLKFIQGRVEDNLDLITMSNVVYSRFFFHATEPEVVQKVLDTTRGMLFIEARSIGDEPLIWKDHSRNLIDGPALVEQLGYYGYEILHYQKGFGLAKFGEEDPLIVRVVANRNGGVLT